MSATGDAATWSCKTCTYLHAEERERGFLSCAVCGAAREEEGSSNSSSPPPPPPPPPPPTFRKRERESEDTSTTRKKVVLKSLPSLPISVRTGGGEKHITDEELQDYAPLTLVSMADERKMMMMKTGSEGVAPGAR
jgi:hypothetical protein